jgi:hypothetical protein
VHRRALVLLATLTALAAAPSALGYPWPLKPFHRAHPIRGNFGDPRTVFFGAFQPNGVDSDGVFSFHNGVDISATPGQAVYPVVSGVAHVPNLSTVTVWTPSGRVFQYVHISPTVYQGQKVVASKTVLGHVDAVAGHVHLSEIDKDTVVNPLIRGHLQPYRDTTKPKVASIEVSSVQGKLVKSQGVTGGIDIVAEAYDTPSLPVPGSWSGYPVAPAFVFWSLESSTGRSVVLPTTVADFRYTIPPMRDFWRVYARGTYQNKPHFGFQQFLSMRAKLDFRLTQKPLDTRRLADGTYVIQVNVADTAGNAASKSETSVVCNEDPTICTPPPPPPRPT